MSKLRVLMTGGGTGGHIYPLVSVAAELQVLAAEKKISLDIHYLGAFGPFQELLELNGLKVGRIADSRLRRYFSMRNFIDVPKFGYSLLQAAFKMFWFMPDVVFSKGGPGALAVVLIARFYRIPVIIHESDSVPGLTNLISGKYANVIATSFESASVYFPSDKIVLTGNPIRRYMLEDFKKESVSRNKGFLGFDPSLPLITVMGGSQGAAALNDFVIGHLREILNITQVLHQTGTANYDDVVSKLESASAGIDNDLLKRYRPVAYLKNDLRAAFIASDLVVSRASGGGIFELAAFGKPSILIPLPSDVAAGDHQTKNAADYCQTGAAVMVKQDEMPSRLLKEVQRLLASPAELNQMSQAATRFSKPEAALNIAETVLKLGGYGES
ncbi:UDP-N-acetylglucosamine--N-acetylmuramyl-(pentapeptide) pyrophosphoryl-undecaprenol N-acetylglucosamine transferase [Patescibacteria group bacterium]|nr:UDP-N-acetylglucosamine--N-acetylmuramyl-(pentapeptide) pyrophosphoryl-undecaprenol N-acetylglucosamine transferase [Patescibacteria group bacterium]